MIGLARVNKINIRLNVRARILFHGTNIIINMTNYIRPTMIALTISMLLTGMSAPIASAEEEKKKDGYSIGLSMYSLRQLIRDGSLTALDYPAFAKKTFGITEIDVWDGGFPKGKQNDIEFYKELKKRSDAAGTNIFLVMTGAVNANGKTAEERKKSGESYLRQVDYANILGAKFVRVFLKAPNGDRDTAIDHSIEALKPLADYAKSKGVIVVIEPGSSTWAKKGTF